MENVLCRFESDFVAGGAAEKGFWHPSTDHNMKRLLTKEKAHVQIGLFSLCRCIPVLILKVVLCSRWEINEYHTFQA